jgi:hypothetical protein
MAHVCRVVRLFLLQGCILIRISMTPSEMGDDLIVEFERSNSTFIMLYLYHEMEVDYLVVEEIINIKIVWLQMNV